MDAEVKTAVERLRGSAKGFAALRPGIEGRAWPLAERFGTEPEARWGPPEILAHVEEMLPFWLGEIERILAGSPEPVPFGRVATDPVRLAIIERDRAVPPRELFDRIATDIGRYERRMAELTASDLARRGLHPRRGEMTVADALEAFVVGHLEEHVVQLREVSGA